MIETEAVTIDVFGERNILNEVDSRSGAVRQGIESVLQGDRSGVQLASRNFIIGKGCLRQWINEGRGELGKIATALEHGGHLAGKRGSLAAAEALVVEEEE